MIFKDTIPRSVSKIKESKLQIAPSRLVGSVLPNSREPQFRVLNFAEPLELLKLFFNLKKFQRKCRTSRNFSWNSHKLFRFPSCMRRFAKCTRGIIQSNWDNVSFLPFSLLLVAHSAINLRELERAIQSIKLLQDNHLLLLMLNPFHYRIMGIM